MRKGRVLRAALIGALLLCAAAAPTPLPAQTSPSKSVFSLWVMDRRNWHSVSMGSAFFISPDGTALTNSHVTYRARVAPAEYALLAIVGNEFYSANLVCSSDLPYDATKPDVETPLSRDVAEVRVVLPHVPEGVWDGGLSNSSGTVFAKPHFGRLPSFPALTLGPDPKVGDPVRILGFGHRSSDIIPFEWSASGSVDAVGAATDGTPVFRVHFSRQAVQGHSGSPMLNLEDKVVGIFAWLNTDEAGGVGIMSSALTPPCR